MRLRRTYIILSIALPFVLSLLCACQREDCSGEVSEAASLCLDLSVPGLRIESKGNADNPFADDISSWTDWEKVVDGRMMYRLTVFLIEKDTDYLVAYRDIYYKNYSGSDVTAPSAPQGPNGWYNGTSVDVDLKTSTQAQISFLYDHPLHTNNGNSFERLQRGTYKLLAVANYSSVNGTRFNGQPSGVASYKGLGNGTFDTYVDGVISEFKTAQNSGTKKKFAKYTHYSLLVDYVLKSSSSSFICPAMPQPLTLATEIDLSPGMNTVSGELLRTFSRIRLSVENMSNVDLTVRSLSFSDNTTKDQTYLFSLPESPDRVYEVGTKKAPVVSSTDAIVSFPADGTKVAKVASVDNTKTVFDAYILESRDLSNNYTYTLNLEYEGEAPAEYFSSVNTTPISNKSGLRADSYYVIMNQANAKWILTAGTDYVGLLDTEIADLTLPIHNEYIWQLQSQGSADSYYVKTVGATTYYIGEPQSNANGLPLTPTASRYFVMENSAQSHIGMKVNSSSSRHSYINVNYPGSKVGGWTTLNGDLGSQFDFYEVSKTLAYPKYSTPIKLTTIDPVTSVVSPVHTIKRNDFINVFVSVSYNKDFGSFEFEVKPWNEVSGDIEFN